MHRWVCVIPLLVACAHSPGAQPAHASIRQPVIDSVDDLDLVMDEHAAMPAGRPERAASRAAIRDWLLTDMSSELRRNRFDAAFERFVSALHLYTADELARPVPDEALLRASESMRATFAPRGGEREVLTALAVRLSFSPKDRDALDRYERLCRWIREAEPFMHDRMLRRDRLIDIHEQVVRDWPSPFVRDRMQTLYLEHRPEAARTPPGLPPRHRFHDRSGMRVPLGYRLSALHLRAGTLETALDAVRRLRGQPGDDPETRRLLTAAASKSATAGDVVALARHFAPRDTDVTERICASALQRMARHPDLLACAARAAAGNGRVSLALSYARSAVAGRPDSPAIRELTARLMRARVAHLVQRERLEPAAREVDEAIQFLAETRQRLPELELRPSAGAFHYLLALGHYQTGSVTRAEKLLEQAITEDAPADAHEHLGIIRWRRGRFEEALASYAAAARAPAGTPDVALEMAARLRRREGDVFRDRGDIDAARQAWRSAIGLWERYMFEGTRGLSEYRLEAVAKAHVERGRLLYELGEVEEALRSIQLAIEAAPERGETYVSSVALLATRGHVAEATDVFHRALGQPEVSDYYKVYCSLWVYDLGRRSGHRPDILARRYLESVDGDQWHHRLARFAAGRISYSEMERQADTPAKKAELFFYEAQNRLAAGRVDEARGLWQRVLGTDMMAFFEYDMAIQYLAAHSSK